MCEAKAEQSLYLFGLSRTLAEQTRNDGLTPEDRALNFASVTTIGSFASILSNKLFQRVLGLDPKDPRSIIAAGLDNVTVAPATCREPDTLPYDVTLIFYNTRELLPSRVFITFPVNVADVNPVAMGLYRISIRR